MGSVHSLLSRNASARRSFVTFVSELADKDLPDSFVAPEAENGIVETLKA